MRRGSGWQQPCLPAWPQPWRSTHALPVRRRPTRGSKTRPCFRAFRSRPPSFAPDGRIFVAEQPGIVKVFDDINDTSPTVFADLRVPVHNWWDRGLLGLVLDSDFPTRPYIYVQYTYNAEIGGVAPRWPSSDGTDDSARTHRVPPRTGVS